jgi:hypothetical protein
LLTDPGLQAVDEAGLVSGLYQDAQFLPAPGYSGREVSAALDWAYADDNRLSVGLTISGLEPPEGVYTSDFIQSISLTDEQGVLYSESLEWTAEPVEGRNDTFSLTIIKVQPLDPASQLDVHIEIMLGGRTAYPFLPYPSSQTPPTEVWIDPVGSLHFEFSIPVYQAILLAPQKTETVANQWVRLERVRVAPSYATLYICYQQPDEGYWLPEAALQVGDLEAIPQAVFNDSNGMDPSESQNCGELEFAGPFVEYLDHLTELTLIVDYFHKPDMPSEQRLELARQELSAQGIEFDYTISEGGGGWSVGNTPEGMSPAEINRRVLFALEDTITGPWKFVVEMP